MHFLNNLLQDVTTGVSKKFVMTTTVKPYSQSFCESQS